VARKSSSTAVQEELYPLPRDASDYSASDRDGSAREPFDDSRLVDLEAAEESPFLRGQKRVSVRRGPLPRKTAIRLKWVTLAVVLFMLLGGLGAALYSYGKHSWRFRIDSSDQIEVSGAQHVSHAQIMEVMGGDIGRNIFFIPLAQRKQQLEQIPWVESASVMRFVPNRLRIEIHERTPIAFARIGSHISLIDTGGNLMELAPGPKHKYSFPVITGMNANEPLSTRAARMKNYNELVRQLDASGAHYSEDLSEADLTDPEDVKVMTAGPNGDVLVHLGSGNYLQRYRVYVTHVQAWRQQFDKLDSVDLRYDGQIIVNPDLDGMARQAVLTPAAAKAAIAAGVKNAAIVNYEKYVAHPELATPAKKPVSAKVATKAPAKPLSKPAKSMAHHSPSKARGKAVVARNSAVPRVAASPATAKPVEGPAASKPIQTPVAPKPTQTPAAQHSSAAATAKPSASGNVAASTASSPGMARPSAGSLKKPSPGIPKETPQN
jgi:cell division protein FtsQ